MTKPVTLRTVKTIKDLAGLLLDFSELRMVKLLIILGDGKEHAVFKLKEGIGDYPGSGRISICLRKLLALNLVRRRREHQFTFYRARRSHIPVANKIVALIKGIGIKGAE